MKQILLILFSTVLLYLTFTSCGDKDDEPGRTPAPEITSEVRDDYVTITAVGQGVVKLYNQGSNDEIDNPTRYMRDYVDYTESFQATAQKPGLPISNTTTKEVVIPKSDNPQVVTAFSVIENENDSTFFEFHIQRDFKTNTITVRKAVDSTDDSQLATFRFKAPISFDRTNGIYTSTGTDLSVQTVSDGKFVTQTDNAVTHLDCKVNIKEQTYSATFDYHGKHFDYKGAISKRYPIVFHNTF